MGRKKTFKSFADLKQVFQDRNKVKCEKNMSYEIVKVGIELDSNNIIPFLRWHYIDKDKLEEFKNKIKTSKQYNISLTGKTNSNTNIESLSGIIPERELDDYIQNLIPYSFIFHVKIKLVSPYFSRDDDTFYLIQNPCLKEKAFKVPMIRGSGWKGALAGAFKEMMNESSGLEERRSLIESFLRIFGAGSESIKALETYLKEKNSNLKDLKDKLLEFALFELGLKVDKELTKEVKNADSEEEILKILRENLSEKIQRTFNILQLPIEFQTHRGRAVFYPTYFDRLSLEIINPHDRRKRAGTNPIHYEVVPKGADGTLQIIYIPFDAVLKAEKDLKDEVKTDLENLCRAVEKLQERGIGAKTKLGWGRFNLEKKKYCVNGDIETCEGWERCQG